MFSIMMASLAAATFQVVAGGDVEQGYGEENCEGDKCDEVCHSYLSGSTARVFPLRVKSEVPNEIGGQDDCVAFADAERGGRGPLGDSSEGRDCSMLRVMRPHLV